MKMIRGLQKKADRRRLLDFCNGPVRKAASPLVHLKYCIGYGSCCFHSDLRSLIPKDHKVVNDELDEEDGCGYYNVPSNRGRAELLSWSDRLKQRIESGKQSEEACLDELSKLIAGKKRIIVFVGPVATTQPKLESEVFKYATLNYYNQTNTNSQCGGALGDLHLLYNIENKALQELQQGPASDADSPSNLDYSIRPTSRREMELSWRDESIKTVGDEELLSFEGFSENPQPVLKYLEKLRYGLDRIYAPTKTHHFLKKLQDDGKLCRVYTESIDSFETKSNVREDLVVNYLGSLDGFHCEVCAKTMSFKEGISFFPNKQNKRGKCELMKNRECGLRPNIILSGDNFTSRISECSKDFEQCDLILVLGTPLTTFPISNLPSKAKENIPVVWVIPEILTSVFNDSNIPTRLKDWIEEKSEAKMITLSSLKLDDVMEHLAKKL